MKKSLKVLFLGAAVAVLGSCSSGSAARVSAGSTSGSPTPISKTSPVVPDVTEVPDVVTVPIVEAAPVETETVEVPVVSVSSPDPSPVVDDTTVDVPVVVDVPAPPATPCDEARPGALCPGDGPVPADVVHASFYDTDESGIYCPPAGASWDATIWAPLQTWPDQFPVSGTDCDPSLPIVVIDVPGGP